MIFCLVWNSQNLNYGTCKKSIFELASLKNRFFNIKKLFSIEKFRYLPSTFMNEQIQLNITIKFVFAFTWVIFYRVFLVFSLLFFEYEQKDAKIYVFSVKKAFQYCGCFLLCKAGMESEFSFGWIFLRILGKIRLKKAEIVKFRLILRLPNYLCLSLN